MVAKKDIVELDISVDQALKYVISMGVVPPKQKKQKINGEYGCQTSCENEETKEKGLK